MAADETQILKELLEEHLTFTDRGSSSGGSRHFCCSHCCKWGKKPFSASEARQLAHLLSFTGEGKRLCPLIPADAKCELWAVLMCRHIAITDLYICAKQHEYEQHSMLYDICITLYTYTCLLADFQPEAAEPPIVFEPWFRNVSVSRFGRSADPVRATTLI